MSFNRSLIFLYVQLYGLGNPKEFLPPTPTLHLESTNPVGSISKWPLESTLLFHSFICHPASGLFPHKCHITIVFNLSDSLQFFHSNHLTSIFHSIFLSLHSNYVFLLAPNFLLNYSGLHSPSLGGPNLHFHTHLLIPLSTGQLSILKR